MLWLQRQDRASCLIRNPGTWEERSKFSWPGATEAGNPRDKPGIYGSALRKKP